MFLLSKENIDYAYSLALKFGWPLMGGRQEKIISIDDLRQESFLGLYEAARHYDEGLGVDFRSFAYIWCRKFVLRALRKYSTPLSVPDNFSETIAVDHIDVSMDMVATAFGDSDDDGSPADRLFFRMAVEEEREREADEELCERMARALEGLSHRERYILMELFYEGHRNDEVSQTAGMTTGRVSQIKERALRKLEERLSSPASQGTAGWKPFGQEW